MTNYAADKLTFYNVYNIKYHTSSRFDIGTRIGNGIIKGIKPHTLNLAVDQTLFVEHDLNGSLYSDNYTFNQSGISATIYHCNYGGYTNQINFNRDCHSDVKIADILDVVNENYYIDDSGVEIKNIGNSSSYKLYLNNVLTDNTERYQETLIELPTDRVMYHEDPYCTSYFLGVCTNWRHNYDYYRAFNTAGIFINRNRSEYEIKGKGRIEDGNLLEYGTARFEKIDEDGKITNLLTLKYFGDEFSEDISGGNSNGGSIHYQLRRGSNIYYKKYSGEDFRTVQKAINDATHLRYHTKYSDINFRLSGDYLFLNKFDMDDAGHNPSIVDVRLDGPFKTHLLPENISTDVKPAIQRLRDLTRQGLTEQVSLVSRSSIDNYPLFVVDLGSIKNISYIDIQSGNLYKPYTYGDSSYPLSFKLTLKFLASDIPFYDTQDSDFEIISDKTENIDMKNNEVKSIESSDLGENFKARYLKFYVTTNDSADVKDGADAKMEWYGAAISGLQIYESDIISSEKYTDSDVINLYKDSTVYEQLYTQELLDNQTELRLKEFQKDNTYVNVTLAYSPHLELGQTVLLTDIESGISRNYFIDSIGSNNGVMNLQLAHYE